MNGKKKTKSLVRRSGKRQSPAGGQVGSVDLADHREQAARCETLFHRPETIGISLAGDHQEAFRRQAESFEARTIETTEFSDVQRPLTPEYHALTVVHRMGPMHQAGDQGKREIPNRRLAVIAIGDQFTKGRLRFGSACKKRIDPRRIEDHRETVSKQVPAGCFTPETIAFDQADLPSEFSKMRRSI